MARDSEEEAAGNGQDQTQPFMKPAKFKHNPLCKVLRCQVSSYLAAARRSLAHLEDKDSSGLESEHFFYINACRAKEKSCSFFATSIGGISIVMLPA